MAELLAVARGEDALLRGLAFEALRVVGAPAEPVVRSVVTEAPLRPYALLWLAEYEGTDPDDAQDVLSREEATWLWVDTAAAVADHGETGLLVRHLDSAVQGTVPALLDEVRAVGHPGPSRCWWPWPPRTRTRPSPKPCAAPPSRCTPAGCERASTRGPGDAQSEDPGAYVPKLQTLPSASRAM